MLRRILTAALAATGLLLFSLGPARAERLGGAYRGPFNDDQVPRNTTDTELTGGQTAPPPSSDNGGNSGGDTGGDSGSDTGDATAPPPPEAPPPTGGEGEGGEGSDPGGEAAQPAGDEAPPPPSGPTPTAPPSGGSTPAPSISLGGGKTPGGGGKVATEDVLAYWSFWFEHNKEWLLGELLRARAEEARIPERSSVNYFTIGSGATRQRVPITEEMKLRKIYPLLVESLASPQSWTRDAAVIALGKSGIPEAVPHLVERVRSDPDPEVRQDALLALGLSRQNTALACLMQTLQGRDKNQKAFAALGLGLLGVKDPIVLQQLVKEYNGLVKVGAEDAACCVAVALGVLGDDSVLADLAKPLNGNLDVLKVYICQALGRIGTDKARDLLTKATKISGEVEAAAFLALSNFPEPASTQRLMRDGLKAGNRMTKLFSIVALARIGASLPPADKLRREMGAALKEMAEKYAKDKYMAMYAAVGLGLLGDDSARDWFGQCLDKDLPKYAAEYISAVALSSGLLDLDSRLGDLRSILKRENIDDDARGYAAFALGIMGDSESKELILAQMKRDAKRYDLLRSSCWAIGLLGDGSDVPVLLDLLKLDGAEKHFVRGAAAVAIGLLRDAAAVEPLLAIAKGDPNPSNRAFAIAALGCLIDKDSVPRMPRLFMNIHYRQRPELIRKALMNL